MLASKHGSAPAERSLYAVIVKNQRVEGRTKQKVVKYLAHISEGQLLEPEHQENFWQRTDQALSELELMPEQRAEIEGKIAQVVARPPAHASMTSALFDPESVLAGSEMPGMMLHATASLEHSLAPAMVAEP